MTTITLKGIEDRHVTVQTGLFIDNKFVPASDNETIDLQNPTTNQHLATVSAAQEADVNKAVQSSKIAFDKVWKKTLPTKRSQLLNRLADLVESHADELATLEALDAGILFMESKNLHVSNAVEVLRYFAGWADKIDGKSLKIPTGFAYTTREPHGVCAAIVPWNAPLMITIWKLAPCIAAGNTLVIKTPELCPLYGQKLAELIKEAGFPAGVVNILCGLGQVAGAALSSHLDVRKIAFTGSGPVGRSILRASAASNLKKVSLELGGKGPSIVFGDADFENALFWTTLGITANNGQVCAAGSRIYVHETIYDEFVQEFSKRSRAAVHGDPLLSTTQKGPVISESQRAKVLAYVDKGKAEGVELLHGGQKISSTGNFIENTAFVGVKEDNTIMREEIFGPVASIAKFFSVPEVINKANNTEYGLAAAVFTNDISRAHSVADQLEAGQVTINCWGIVNANTPFGGVKQSGFGRDTGENALEEWTAAKVVKVHLLSNI